MAAPTPRDAVARGRDIDLRLTLLERRMSRPGGGSIATTRITDWNSATASGNYVGVSAANAPTSTGTYVGAVYATEASGSFQVTSTQVLYSLSSPFRVWRRYHSLGAGGWTAWTQHEIGAGSGASTWDEITGKPSTFPSTWATVSGKPSTFPPSAHTHPASQITGLPAAVQSAIPAATETVQGKARLATLNEARLTPASLDPSVDLDGTIMTPQRVMDMLDVYVPAAGYTGTGLWIDDWNDATRVGFYNGSSSTLNRPPTTEVVTGLVYNAGSGSHSAGGFGTIIQEVHEVTTSPSVGRTFRRVGFDQTWGAWAEVSVDLAWADITGKPSTFPSTWATVSGKPSTFPPSAHTHAWSQITGKPESWGTITQKPIDAVPADFPMGESVFFANTLPGYPSTYGTVRTIRSWSAGGGTLQFWTGYNTHMGQLYMRQWPYSSGPWTEWKRIDVSDWADILNKPSTFTPSAHTHPSSQITDFSSAVDARVNALVPAATTSQSGKVELATNAETQAGTLSSRAVTPASLTARTATESRTGLARLATFWEAVLTPTSIDPSIDVDNTIMTPQRVMDMLEGYVPAAGYTGTSLQVDDWNDATRVGFYSGFQTAQNSPPTSNQVVGLVHNGGYGSHSSGGFGTIVQEVVEVATTPSALRTFRRSGFDGTWTAWEEINGAPSWASITGKPSTFPSTWATVSGKPSTFPPSSHSHAWSTITGKPSTFAPSAHTHSLDDITTPSIPGGVDLNTYTTQGLYHQSANAQASTGSNYPIAHAGLLEVFAPHVSFTYQRYTVYSGDGFYVRARYSSTWHPWRHITEGGGGTGGGASVAAGTITYGMLNPGSSSAVTVTFPVGRFTVPPIVTATNVSAGHSVSVGTATTSSVTVTNRNTAAMPSSGSKVNWTAIQPE